VNTTGNKIERKGDDETSKCAAECPINKDRPTAAIRCEKRLSEPGANSSSRNASKDAALEKKCTNADRWTPATQTDDERGGNNAQAKKNCGDSTPDETDSDANTNEH
jgi:hypothetical protein